MYSKAQELYADFGVNTETALKRLGNIPVSIHCWQGDDLGGFERPSHQNNSGVAVTGNFPGKARTQMNSARILSRSSPSSPATTA